MQKFLCVWIVFLAPGISTAQLPSRSIDPSLEKTFFSLDTLIGSYTDSTNSAKFLELPLSVYKPGLPYWKGHFVKYLSFSLRTQLPTTQYLFAEEMGNMQIYQTDRTGKRLKEIKPDGYAQAAAVVYPISISADSTYYYVIRTETLADGSSANGFWLIPPHQLEIFFHYYRGTELETIANLWVMTGMLLMMFLYIGAKSIQVKSAEYGYYAAYIVFLLVYVSLRIGVVLNYQLSFMLGDWYIFLNNQLQVAAYGMYFPFLAAYLKTKTKNPFLHKHLVWLPFILIGYIGLDAGLIYFRQIEIHLFLWNAVRVILLLLVLYFAYLISKMKTPYGLYPIIGALFLDFFGLVSMVLSLNYSLAVSLPQPFSFPVFYYFVGISIELVFFSLGLGYKNKQDEVEKIEAQEALKLAAERQKFEQYKTVVEVQERERIRIARDLHDGLGGTLAGIKISLANLMPELSLTENQKLQLDRSVDLLNNSVHELRTISHNMMPPLLVQYGLASALRDYCDTINGMKTVQVTFQLMGQEIRQPLSHEIAIYRIVQELINNIVKHAQAQQALVELVFDAGAFSVTVEDDGHGFDTAALSSSKNAGWKNIRSRIDLLQGVLDLRSDASGTSIHLSIPLLPARL
ncbi:MAG: sensor histidine kinase [Bacteroidetes bacterium]|nr:sensor histidine kinase [Bacteroidota bacterium]